MKSQQELFTSYDFEKHFPNDEACLEWIKNHRYPNGILCVSCKKVTKHHKLAKRPVYECDRCGHQVSPLAGTIFHKSTTSLTIWFDAIHEMATTRTGFSAKALQRKHGMTYKTAWRIFNQVRKLLYENPSILSGEVEVDETYVGGHRKGLRGVGLQGKSVIVGITERKGKVSSKVVTDVSKYTVMPLIERNVTKKAIIYSDESALYSSLGKMGYEHKTINHRAGEYVVGKVHTNTIEGFWSLVKRGIDGCYHAVSPKYLQSYVNEYQFRYNHRLESNPMFLTVLDQI
jgi:transposase